MNEIKQKQKAQKIFKSCSFKLIENNTVVTVHTLKKLVAIRASTKIELNAFSEILLVSTDQTSIFDSIQL